MTTKTDTQLAREAASLKWLQSRAALTQSIDDVAQNSQPLVDLLSALTRSRQGGANAQEQLRQLHEGESVVLPKTAKHAKEMMIVAQAIFDGFTTPTAPSQNQGDNESARAALPKSANWSAPSPGAGEEETP